MDETQDKRTIKFLLTEDEHDLIRIAAAIKQTTMASFCRDLTLREATATVDGYTSAPRQSRKGRNTSH